MLMGSGVPGPRFHFTGSIVISVAMRTYISSAAFALVAAGFVAPLGAQDTTAVATGEKPTTHLVVKGDNLWSLSQRYLSNPFLWTELYRLNRDVVEDPHWIYPGEVLRLPGEEPLAVVSAPTQRENPDAQSQGVSPPTAPVAPPAPAVDMGLQSTLFKRTQAAGNAATSTSAQPAAEVPMADPPTVRTGEMLVAPFVDREGGPRASGSIVRSGDLAGIAQASDKERFQPYDRVMIQPPVGHVAPEGERYLSYRLGPVLPEQGQIVVPTGVVEVIRAPRDGAPAIAKIVKAFAELQATDRLIPLDTAGSGLTARPVRVADGPSTTVSWVAGDPVLPSLQNYVVLAVTSRNGVRIGDEFILYRDRPRQVEGELQDPTLPVGKAQVVRSTPYGVTAVIIGQEQPHIQPGMPARVSAKMP